MSIHSLYSNLHTRSARAILDRKYFVDTQIDSPADTRYGITLLLRPSPEILEGIEPFRDALKQVDNRQYYYPHSDIHITILSIISCYEGFDMEDINLAEYVAVIRKSLAGLRPFQLVFEGVTASETGALIQGFPQDATLNGIRNALRVNFRKSGLQQSIDSRYPIQSAHATVVRFRRELARPEDFLRVLEKYRTYYFGMFQVSKVELVFNDWYQKQKNCKTLHVFRLGG